MKARTTATGIIAGLALMLPGAALGAEAGSIVPPENSAATQYTEALPTAGGDKQAGGGHKPSPAKVLGSKNAHKLESQGKEGHEVAEVVAETAPQSSPPAEPEPAPQRLDSKPATGGGKQSGSGSAKPAGGKADGRAAAPAKPATPPQPKPQAELPSGSSGLGEVIAEATGSSSSGDLGALLPLAIAAAIAWSLAYLWRQRRPAE
jgi:hypothetical protein